MSSIKNTNLYKVRCLDGLQGQSVKILAKDIKEALEIFEELDVAKGEVSSITLEGKRVMYKGLDIT